MDVFYFKKLKFNLHANVIFNWEFGVTEEKIHILRRDEMRHCELKGVD